MSHNSELTVFVVVEVMSGVAEEVHCFRTRDDAFKRAEQLKVDRNPNNDDVQVFRVIVPSASVA